MEPPNSVQEINNEEPPHSPSSEIDPDGPTEEPDIVNDDDSPITNSELTHIFSLKIFLIFTSLCTKKEKNILENFVSEYTVYNVYGSAVRPRPSGRGHTKRGRPRGSRSRVGTGIGRSNVVGNGPITTGVGTRKCFLYIFVGWN